TIIEAFYGPLRPQAIIPHPFKLANFGLAALRSASGLAHTQFKGARARTLFAGVSGHAMLPLTVA
ncbi:MAG: FAD-dependent oxidoreductase, partial [Ktedonobacteraceae bacterium]